MYVHRKTICVRWRVLWAIELRLNAVVSVHARQDEYIADACCWVAEPSLRLAIALVRLPYKAELVLQEELRYYLLVRLWRRGWRFLGRSVLLPILAVSN